MKELAARRAAAVIAQSVAHVALVWFRGWAGRCLAEVPVRRFQARLLQVSVRLAGAACRSSGQGAQALSEAPA